MFYFNPQKRMEKYKEERHKMIETEHQQMQWTYTDIFI